MVSEDDQTGGGDWGGVYGNAYGTVYGGPGGGGCHVSDGGAGRLVLMGLDLGGQCHVGDGVVSALCVALAAQGRERCRLRHLSLARCGLGGKGARVELGWGRGPKAWRAVGPLRADR